MSGFGQTLINGAGATFPYPIYSKWFDEFHKLHPDAQINYQSIGSGGGIRQLEAGTVDFGASDQPMNDEQLKKQKTPVLHFPTVLGAVVATYNIEGVSAELNLTPEAIAGVFLGTIKQWNDPAIAKPNPGVKLPAADIVVVHRSDGSGTTFIWTDFLSKGSADWKAQVGSGTSVKWPVGLGAKGNEGVSGLVKQTPNSFGYVELIYAIQNQMPYARVRNAAGLFVKAELASVTAAAAGAAAGAIAGAGASSRTTRSAIRSNAVVFPAKCRISASPSPTRRAKRPTRSPALPGCWCPRESRTPRRGRTLSSSCAGCSVPGRR